MSWPVGCIIFGSTGNILWVICKFILLNFRLQIFGFGSARAWTWCVTTFTIQLLLFWFVSRRGSRVWILPQLQEAFVSFLVLPVCEDLWRKHNTSQKLQTVKGGRREEGKLWHVLSLCSNRGLQKQSWGWGEKVTPHLHPLMYPTCLCSSRARRRRLAEESRVSSSSCRVSSSSMPIPSSSERPRTAV